MITRIILFEDAGLVLITWFGHKFGSFEGNYSDDHTFRSESQWTKLATEWICRHVTEEIVDQAWDPRVICVDCFRVSCWEWSYWILWFQLEANCHKILRSKIHIVLMIFKWHFHTLKCEAYICWILKRLIFLWMDNNQPHITEICYNLNSFIRHRTIQIKVTFKAGLLRRHGNWACTVLYIL